jgi:hypothetical protein
VESAYLRVDAIDAILASRRVRAWFRLKLGHDLRGIHADHERPRIEAQLDLSTQVDYDDLFKLFMTSKMPNPHYLPEVAIKTTIINFTVTMEGLEDQLLGPRRGVRCSAWRRRHGLVPAQATW